MTAYELSEKKVIFTNEWKAFFEKESDFNGKIILTTEELNNLLATIKEGIIIINEYLKEKG